MTSYAPTPADFMRMTDGPDFEPIGVPDVVSVHGPQPTGVDLAEVLAHLERIEALIQAPVELEAEVHRLAGELQSRSDDLMLVSQRIDDALEAIKKSTSKVAKDVRAILQPEPLAPAPVPQAAAEADQGEGQEPDPEEGKGARIVRATPAPDADVSEWRAYGEQQGLAGTEDLNASQFRTMLGVAHPGETAGNEGGA